MFPETRLRRFRRTPDLRRLVRETRLSADDLVLPLFVCPGEDVANPVSSMPGVFQQSVDKIVETARGAYAEGIRAVLLFGLPSTRTPWAARPGPRTASSSMPCRALAKEVPGLVKIVDVCFCEYTDHGHCGVLNGRARGGQRRHPGEPGEAVRLAGRGRGGRHRAVGHDGRPGGAIRYALDEAGFSATPILSYAVKFASGFYGPFGRPRIRPRSSATAGPTRWTRPTAARPCGKPRWTCRRGRTCSW